MLVDPPTPADNSRSSEDAVDEWQVAASFDAGLASVSLGYLGKDDDGKDSWGGAVGGNAGGLSWKVGYQANEDTNNVYGLHLGYGVGGGNLYGQYEDCNEDGDTGTSCSGAGDDRSVIFGYSYGVGPGTRIIAEHKNRQEAADKTILALRVDF